MEDDPTLFDLFKRHVFLLHNLWKLLFSLQERHELEVQAQLEQTLTKELDISPTLRTADLQKRVVAMMFAFQWLHDL